MFGSIAKSWDIAKVSWGLLMEDKKLLLFPVLSGLVLLAVLVSFGLPVAFLGVFKGLPAGALTYVVGFVFYFLAAFVIIFFNSALVGAVNLRMQGQDPTLGDGLRCAWDRKVQILGYAAISATVGLLLRMLRNRAGIVGRVTAFFGGLAWALATYVAVPVLVIEGLGPVSAIQRSTGLIRKTWGHQVAGHVGFGLFQFLVSMAILAVAVPTVWLALQSGWAPLVVLLVAAAITVQVASVLVFTTLATIYSTAVFRYASTGESGLFPKRLMEA